MLYDPAQDGLTVKTVCTICGCDHAHPDAECPCECHVTGRPPQISGVLLIAGSPATHAQLARRPGVSAQVPLVGTPEAHKRG